MGETMTTFEIKDTEIQDLIQLSKLQGGSKYRQEEIYKLLDRVVARKDSAKPEVPTMPDLAEKMIDCPYCGKGNKFYRNQIDRQCGNCGKGYFRDLNTKVELCK